MKKKACFRKWIAFIAAALALSCLPGLVLAQPVEGKIGLLVPLTGRAATIGQEVRDATFLTVDDINNAGGFKSLGGAKIALVVADTESKPEVGMSETERLKTNEKVIAIIGAHSSGVTFACAQIAEKHNERSFA